MTTAKTDSPTLREAQEWLASIILEPERLDGEADQVLAAAPNRGSLTDRLQVYIDGYPARVQEALAETFEAVAQVIGPQALERLTKRYVRAVPLRSYNLGAAGAALPAFLRHDQLSARFPFLPDLATLEWRVAEAFHAGQQPVLDPAALSGWDLADWERAVLRFRPGVATVSSQWPIRDIWLARRTPVEDIDIDLRNRPEQVLVCRVGFEVRCEPLEAREALALTALLAGSTLAEVNGILSEQGCEPAEVSSWFERWLRLGVVAGCSITRLDVTIIRERERC